MLYSARTRKPIHVFDDGSDRDSRRNRFFTHHGWSVVRFSEMQVTLSVYGCCRIVEQVVAMIECRPESLFYAGIATPPPHSRWTEEVAMQMAGSDSRRYCTWGTLAEHTRPRR